MSIRDRITEGKTLVFIGAHPDDEVLVGPLLAFAADHSAAHVECITSGEAGWNLLGAVHDRTLGDLRCEELRKACGVLGASYHVLGYVNGNSTAHDAGIAVAEDEEAAVARWKDCELAEKPDEVLRRWSSTDGPLAPRLQECIQTRPGCVVVTFDPIKGFTEHREHCAVGLAVNRLFRLGDSDGSCELDAEMYYVLSPDQAQPTDERIEGSVLTKYGRRDYVHTALKAQGLHETQCGKLGSEKNQRYITGFRSAIEPMILRPFSTESHRQAARC